MTDYPTLRIRMTDDDAPPVSKYVVVELDGQDISDFVRYLELSALELEPDLITVTMVIAVRPDIELPAVLRTDYEQLESQGES